MQQVTVAGGDVNTSVTFTKNVTDISISFVEDAAGNGFYTYYLSANTPVTTAISSTVIHEWKEVDESSGTIQNSGSGTFILTIPAGSRVSNEERLYEWYNSSVSHTFRITEKSKPWNGQTINGARYTANY